MAVSLYSFGAALSTYTKKGNKWVFGGEYLLKNNPYKDTSIPCIFGRHRWACACPVKRASDAMIIAMYFLMVSVLEVR